MGKGMGTGGGVEVGLMRSRSTVDLNGFFSCS